jgi:outer membrane receptor protein involved in Fe transport
MFFWMRKGGAKRRQVSFVLVVVALVCGPGSVFAQEDDDEEEKSIDEITVVGSQIKGANITDALAVTVVDSEAIGQMGVDSMDDLMALIPENGQNFFNEAENISGGVNSARGDIGAFNLRNLGTGNTLVLLNGRRLVNAAAYQTEEIGGSFVPVNTVNSASIPVWGIERVEILRDGASAIYGADAVAGVVNTVLQDDFEGFSVRLRYTDFENISRDTQTVTLEWGKDFNDGRTNVAVFANYFQRDRVNSSEDPKWGSSTLGDFLPDDSLWKNDSEFRDQNSANSLFGQFDIVGNDEYGLGDSGMQLVDNSGDLQLFPIGHPQCEYMLNEYVCGNADNGGIYRNNLNLNRDLSSELQRSNMFIYINHEFESGLESFTEILGYQSKTNLIRHGSYPSQLDFVVAADNYWNPLGPCSSPNRLPGAMLGEAPGACGSVVPAEGVAWDIENYRFDEAPRIIDNDGDTYRVLQGLRGSLGEWNWESAVSWSRATKDDVTHNRVSNTLMQEALADPTSAAYNPFSGGVNSNIERARVDVTRHNETELKTFDIRFANNELFNLPAGPVGVVAGAEWREESFLDDRDPRLDGTIAAVADDGTTFPFVSDVVNSSPSSDSSGSRQVTSLFGELQLPLHDTLDVQLALRYEDFDDIGKATTVGKVAFGWRPVNDILVRGSWSEAYRAPNLVTVNEGVVARVNSRVDHACLYASENGGDDPANPVLDCVNSVQRVASGSELLVPEESENTSIGFVLTPADAFTVTFDYWTIEKDKTIGLFGEENHTALDLLMRLENGGANCDSSSFNTAVNRDPASSLDPEAIAIYQAAGICPAGDIVNIFDLYTNLDTRTVKGFDIGVYYDFDTRLGNFSIQYNGSFLEKYQQDAGGNAAVLVAAKEAGTLPATVPVVGFADLIGMDGNQDEKHSIRFGWRKDSFAAGLSGYRLGNFYSSELTLADGTQWIVPAFTTWDTTFDYTTDIGPSRTRFRLGIKNISNSRAPFTDGRFGFTPDAHSDYGRHVYLDVRARF